jgi:RNA polymerase sigma-70 factor, ECF subfamily
MLMVVEPVEQGLSRPRLEPAADADLLAEVAAGDQGDALRELYRRYAQRVYGLGVQLLSERGLAEELVQETFVRLWRNAGRYDPHRGSAATFIFTMARRLAIDLWRRPSSRPAAADRPVPEEDEVDRLMVRIQVRDALESISESHREVLELSYLNHLRQAEIANKLDIPLGTVKTRTYHALRSLRAALEERDIHG